MKVMVEISDEQVVEFLKACINTCLSVSLPRTVPMQHHEFHNLSDSLRHCYDMNRVIDYLGGVPVDLAKIERYTGNDT